MALHSYSPITLQRQGHHHNETKTVTDTCPALNGLQMTMKTEAILSEILEHLRWRN